MNPRGWGGSVSLLRVTIGGRLITIQELPFMIKITLLTVIFALFPLGQDDTQDTAHPVRHDRTGITWTTPFESALSLAQSAKRLLVIKPVAFGTTPEGCW